MPVSTSTYATISEQIQNQINDTTTDVWSAAQLLSATNEATYAILDDLIYYRADLMYDALLDNLNMTLTAEQEYVAWGTALTGGSKTFYTYLYSTWDGYPVTILGQSEYWQAKKSVLNATTEKPYGCFKESGKLYLQPTPTSGNTTTFYFFFVKPPTAMTGSASTSSLSEPCVKLYKHKVAEIYWQRRGNPQRSKEEMLMYQTQLRRTVSPYKHAKTYSVQSVMKD